MRVKRIILLVFSRHVVNYNVVRQVVFGKKSSSFIKRTRLTKISLFRNESADRVSDLQNLLQDWERNKDLKHPVKLEAFGVQVKGTEDLLYDSENCKHKPKHSKHVKPKDLPIPDTCPNPLMS